MSFSKEVNLTLLENYETALTNVEDLLQKIDKHFKRHLSYHIKDLEELKRFIDDYQACRKDVELWKGLDDDL